MAPPLPGRECGAIAEHGGTAKAPGAILLAGAKRRQYYRQRAAGPRRGRTTKRWRPRRQAGAGRQVVTFRFGVTFRPAAAWMQRGRGAGRPVSCKRCDSLRERSGAPVALAEGGAGAAGIHQYFLCQHSVFGSACTGLALACRTGCNGTPIFLTSYSQSEAAGIITTDSAASAALLVYLRIKTSDDQDPGDCARS